MRRRDFPCSTTVGARVALPLKRGGGPSGCATSAILMPYTQARGVESRPCKGPPAGAWKAGMGGRGTTLEFDERWSTDNLELVRANAASWS